MLTSRDVLAANRTVITRRDPNLRGRTMMVGSGQADATADATLAVEQATFLYSLMAMFGGGGHGFSELGMGAPNIATEYDVDEAVVKRPPAAAGPASGGRRTPRSSKEKIAFGFERRAGGAGGAEAPRGFKGEMATSPISCMGEVAWDSEVPSVLSLEERFEKDLDLSRSPSIADATPPGSPPTTDASPVSSLHRKGFAFGFERLTGDAAGGGGRRTPRSFKGNVAFGFERRMGEAGSQVGDDDAGGGTGASKVEYFQGRRTPRGSKGDMATSPISSQDGMAPPIASLHAAAGGQLLPPLPGCHVGRGARWRWLVAANRRRASVGSEDM